jgi:NaMN:DMB phosphoribosyltransferase
LAGIPVILDGACAVAALMALCRVNRAMADHCATAWQPPKEARQWLRENTGLLFMPSAGEDEPGMEGAALIETALSL